MRAATWIFCAALIACLAALPSVASTFVLSLTLSIAMYAGLALSWSMFSGATGYVALSTSAFFGLGAYTCAILLGSLPWPLVVAGGAAVAAVSALILGLCVLHLRGTYFAILTFGISELLKNLIMYIEKSEFGTVGRLMMGAPSLPVIYWTVLALAVLAAVMYWLVARSDFGAALRAIGSDEGRASTLGLNVRNAKIAGFCLSAFIPGAIGAAMSVRWTYIEPQIVFNPFIVFQTVLVATIGGPTRLAGPILGAVVFGLLQETLRLNFANYYLILLGVLLILSVLYIPNGLVSLFNSNRSGAFKRASTKHV
jgi:branched-chain amino acid transport system permease protein